MKTEIKECPFCQHKMLMPHVKERTAKTAGRYHYFVRCPKCYTEGPRSLSSKEDAIEGWNRRAAPSVANAENSDALPPLPEPLEIDWPELHSQALGCGVEDRNIHDRYQAAEYGWQDGVDKAVERVPEAIYDADQVQAYALAALAHAAPNAQLVQALTEMVSWFGRYPEWTPVPEASDNVKASIDKARAALASLPPQKEAL